MSVDENEVLDSQIIAENVEFLDKSCYSELLSSLETIKNYNSDEKATSSTSKAYVTRTTNTLNSFLHNKSLPLNLTLTNILSQHLHGNSSPSKRLKDWGLPSEITKKYEQKGIVEMFDWQVSCLSNSKVLFDCCNLVYSAPTSAGKTLVAEIITIKTVLERQKKVIIILPFVSIVREKTFYLQDVLSSSGIRVEGFMGSQTPAGGLQAVHVAICTIEKANSLVNKLLDEGNIAELGAIIVDELHLLGDPHRGYILELLLAKIKYVSTKFDMQIQIVGMSATLPNLDLLANWLSAELFVTQFRPIPLDEYCLIGNKYFDKHGNYIKEFKDGDHILNICLETIADGCSVLIFCMTKNRCENLAQNIASSFYGIGHSGNQSGTVLREQLKSENIAEVLEQLKNCPVGLDPVLKQTTSFGVAYHHAGLTFDERDIIEGAFKSGAIRVLVATSTLSSGVNLPARKVVIRSPVFQKEPINVLTYKQMVGRAGRMGRDSKGESILICTEAEKRIGINLLTHVLDPVKSCLKNDDKYMRAILEMIASQVACTKEELNLYSKCTLMCTQDDNLLSLKLLESVLDDLINYELIRTQTDGHEKRYLATLLGKACLSSSVGPNDGLSIYCELQKARQYLVLETDLHLIYLVTPYSVSNQWGNIDWLHLLTLWESSTLAMKRVGNLVGIKENFIVHRVSGTNKNICPSKLNIHLRFYTALALQDLVNEVPLSNVAKKFQCARGFLQSLQQAAATFAGMVTAFCRQLGWKHLETLISQFQDRLHFGIHSELLELMKLPSLNGMRARILFDAGFETISTIASADMNSIENILYKAAPFQSEKCVGDDVDDIRKRKRIKNIWITGYCGMTIKEAAENLITEARKHLECEIGGAQITWKQLENDAIIIQDTSNAERVLNVKQECKEMHTDLETQHLNELPVATILKEGDKSPEKYCEILNVHSISGDEEHRLHDPDNNVVIIENEEGSSVEDNKLNISKNISLANNLNHIEEKNSTTEVNNYNSKNKMPSNSASEVVWLSLNFSQTAIENVLNKMHAATRTSSPNVSFGETEKSNLASRNVSDNVGTSRCATIKDISLFSSEGDNSSLFDDSLVVDMVPSKLLNNGYSENSKLSNKETSSIIANDSIIVIDDNKEEDINVKNDTIEMDTFFNTSEEVEVMGTQEIKEECIKNNINGLLKRRSQINKKTQQNNGNSHKRVRSEKNIDLKEYIKSPSNRNLNMKLRHPHSRKCLLEVFDFKIFCFVLRENDILDNFHIVESYCFVNTDDNEIPITSMYISTKDTRMSNNEVIGRNILSPLGVEIEKSDTPLVKSICFSCGLDLCIFLDVCSLGELLSEFKTKLRNCFQMKSKLKMLSLKYNYVIIKKFLGIDLPTSCFDVSLAEWLIDSDEKVRDILYLIEKYFQVNNARNISMKIDNEAHRFEHLDSVPNVCFNTCCIRIIAEKQETFLLNLYQNIQIPINVEMQVLKILADCEYYGLAFDKHLAKKLLTDIEQLRQTLQLKASQVCGQRFNFNSNKQLRAFLDIPPRGSTKKSVLKTQKSVLAKIIIHYRTLQTVLTKTLYPLNKLACVQDSTDRIHPSYSMNSCTGRIYMHEPNLQLIPRTFVIPKEYLSLNISQTVTTADVEINCRNMIKASPGCILVAADYCQLEMRVLTHFCEDKALIDIMRSDVDVFKSIASTWNDVPMEQVDDDLRYKTKQLCYGVIYGMGSKSLAELLDITPAEASVLMNSFFTKYSSIKLFTDAVVQKCRRDGYVETLMKRRRYIANINAHVGSVKSAAERQAVNTTIQGSAADIAKAAMCAIDNEIKGIHLILQMHDELIYEVPVSLSKLFMSTITSCMENTVKLKVPLPVKLKCGYSWGALTQVEL